jgi:hypothetical protein
MEPGRRNLYWDHQPVAVLGTDSVLSAPVIVTISGPALARNYQAMIAKPRAGAARGVPIMACGRIAQGSAARLTFGHTANRQGQEVLSCPVSRLLNAP